MNLDKLGDESSSSQPEAPEPAAPAPPPKTRSVSHKSANSK
jgi:hypothetical protein